MANIHVKKSRYIIVAKTKPDKIMIKVRDFASIISNIVRRVIFPNINTNLPTWTSFISLIRNLLT